MYPLSSKPFLTLSLANIIASISSGSAVHALIVICRGSHVHLPCSYFSRTIYYFAVTVDWLITNMVSVRGSNIGHLRYVMKNTLQYIPLYGWYFYVHGCIYVKRGNFNQSRMIDSLNYLKSDKVSVSICKRLLFLFCLMLLHF